MAVILSFYFSLWRVESNFAIVFITTLCHWLKTFAPLSYPIVGTRFPALGTGYIYLTSISDWFIGP